jgi:Tfp pilus assembly protein FimT
MKARGFTLAETALVLALAGVLIYCGAVTFNKLVPKFRLQSGVWAIRSTLNEARFGAIWTGMPRRVRFGASGYTLESYDESSRTWRMMRTARLEGVEVEANNDPAFYPEGTVTNLATVTVSNSRGTYKITVAISGRIKVLKAG